MTKEIEYKTRGTCSRMIKIKLEDGIITDCAFVGGCAGNTQGVASLVKGMNAKDAIGKIKGIKCGFKGTSCPDQLALALETALGEENV
ncbi:MAG: TIGR03905 family TSCPD domain-containing protein [Clostridia bacterium]|nr:TIGR03905 family TSCPD domain-containing protein [Clostridia bacterium]